MSAPMSEGDTGASGSRARSSLGRVLRWLGGGMAVVVALFFGLGLTPRATPLGADVAILEAGAPTVRGAALLPYSAAYSTWTRVLGVPIKSGRIETTLARTPAGVEVAYDFGGGFADRMLLDGSTLAPIRRGFPGQEFEFAGADVQADLGGDGGDRDIRTFSFPGRPFEVSVLDLVIATGVDVPVRLGWDNFADTDAWLAHATQVGEETVSIGTGEVFETRIVDIGFADGTVRRYWVADRPPYKIRQRTFERGRSIVSAWDVEDFQLR